MRYALAAALLLLAGGLPPPGHAATPERTVAFDPPRVLPAFTLAIVASLGEFQNIG